MTIFLEKKAGTWINLQDAFVLEKADGSLGDWIAIGYSAPGSGSSNSYKTDVFNYTNESGNVWTAAARVDLNDCKTGGTWTITPAIGTNDNRAVNYTVNSNVCTSLTPSFANLQHTDR